MKAAVFEEAGKVEVEDVAMPTIQDPEDVIIKVVRTCVCGSDLWAYSAGDAKESTPWTMATKQLGLWKKQVAPLRR